MSWYRTYRPTQIAGLHLVSVRDAILRMMKTGAVPHALLFAGPKGTGKTSTARILSALLNDPANAEAVDQIFFGKKNGQSTELHEPNPDSEVVQRIYRGASFAVTEIDAASYRGIDDIRLLKERMSLPPQDGKISVYILDEVHMLTTEAFNALLKMLEEPPAHVVFILATTETHKIPDTIASRATLVQFHRASTEELTASLQSILKQEGISAGDGTLEVVVSAADGSFRDAVKLLESVSSGKKKISLEDVERVLKTSSGAQCEKLLDAIIEKQEKTVVQICNELRNTAVDEKFFLKSLLLYLHQCLLHAILEDAGQQRYVPKVSHYFLQQFSSIPVDARSPIPFLFLELKALELITKSKEKAAAGGGSLSTTSSSSAQPAKKPFTTPTPLASKPHQIDVVEVQNVVQIDEGIPEQLLQPLGQPTDVPETSPVGWLNGQILIEKWDQFLIKVHDKNSSIEALLRSAKPISASGEKTQVEVYYQFHREQLQQPKFTKLLEECIIDVLGGRVMLEFSLATRSTSGAALSTVSGVVNEDDGLIQLAKEILV